MPHYTTQGVIRPNLPRAAFNRRDLKALEVAGITAEPAWNEDTHFALSFDDGIDPEHEPRVIKILRRVLLATPAITHIEIEGSLTASRMMDNGFGGFCTLIGPNNTYGTSTTRELAAFRQAEEVRDALAVVLELAQDNALDTDQKCEDLREEAQRQHAAISRLQAWGANRLGSL